MKGKSNHKKDKKDKKEKKEELFIKEIGIFDDFLVIEKEEKNQNNTENINKKIIKEEDNKNGLKSKNNVDMNNFSFYNDWIICNNPKDKQKQSRFSDLFKKIQEEENPKTNNLENKEEDDNMLKKDDSLKYTSSLNLSSQNTFQSSNFDSKVFEGISINDSLLDINNNNKINENKIIVESNSNLEELDLNVDINKVISLEDKRATIMIKNIPNKFNKNLLLSIIDQNFKGTYDLFILPTDINKLKNFGYCFINFTSSYYIPYFYFMFNGKMWSSTNSKKVCELTYSKVQGKKDLLYHYPIKIVHWNEGALNATPEQQYIIPNVYKLIFNKYFPKEKIEEKKFYFITKMPTEK